MRRINHLPSALLLASCCALAVFATRRISAEPTAVEDPKAVVEALYRAFDAGDLNAVTDLIADDAAWTYYGPEYVLPFAGTFHGPDGVSEFFRLVDQTLGEPRAGQRQLLVSGNQVTVPGWEESTVKTTGARYRVDNVHLFTVRNGKIATFAEFINSADVVEGFLPADPARGQALFTTCAGCHGSDAEGRPEMNAPNLAGLDTAYLTRQLRNFRGGLRGNMEDLHGYMMIGRASALPGDRGVRDVVAHISKLPQYDAPATIEGNVQNGRQLYQTCATCHGVRGEGNEQLGAPRIEQLHDQYLVTQLNNFYTGVRGSVSGDLHGQQMRAATQILAHRTAFNDVVAYIKSL